VPLVLTLLEKGTIKYDNPKLKETLETAMNAIGNNLS
jgi:hypothetical protein